MTAPLAPIRRDPPQKVSPSSLPTRLQNATATVPSRAYVSCILCQPAMAARPASLPGARAGPAARLTSSDAPSWDWIMGTEGCQKSSQMLRPIRPSGSPTSVVRTWSPARVKRPSSNMP